MARVLIVRISSFGDVAMLVPAVYSVAAKYPQDRFVVLTRKAFSPLFEGLGFNVGTKSFDPHHHAGFWGLMKLTLSILKGGYSHIADMHDVLRSKVIRFWMSLQGKKVRHINKERNERNEFIKYKTLDNPLKHVALLYLDVFERIGFPAELSFTNYFEFRKRSLYPLRAVIKEKTGNWIGLAPFSKHEGKTYPLHKMENVLSSLVDNSDNHVFLFSSGNDENMIVEQWEKKYRNVISVQGKLNLENEMLLISFCDVMISMDSANMHLASLVETPVVSVWGATHPGLGFYGYGQSPDNAVQMELECRPCSVFGNLPCRYGTYACLNNIDESAILEKAEKILSAKPVPALPDEDADEQQEAEQTEDEQDTETVENI
jgi:ADP-heptose:LPS heptosyltransferase